MKNNKLLLKNIANFVIDSLFCLLGYTVMVAMVVCAILFLVLIVVGLSASFSPNATESFFMSFCEVLNTYNSIVIAAILVPFVIGFFIFYSKVVVEAAKVTRSQNNEV